MHWGPSRTASRARRLVASFCGCGQSSRVLPFSEATALSPGRPSPSEKPSSQFRPNQGNGSPTPRSSSPAKHGSSPRGAASRAESAHGFLLPARLGGPRERSAVAIWRAHVDDGRSYDTSLHTAAFGAAPLLLSGRRRSTAARRVDSTAGTAGPRVRGPKPGSRPRTPSSRGRCRTAASAASSRGS